jgi:hypothetical protein
MTVWGSGNPSGGNPRHRISFGLRGVSRGIDLPDPLIEVDLPVLGNGTNGQFRLPERPQLAGQLSGRIRTPGVRIQDRQGGLVCVGHSIRTNRSSWKHRR